MGAWKLIRSRVVVDTAWLRVLSNEYRLPNGNKVQDYYVVERADFVLVVAIREGSVVLVRQYRPATAREYLSLPAGYLRPDEKPQAAAARELREETGLTSTDIKLIGELDPLPGYVKSKAHVVVCANPVGELIPEDSEEISGTCLVPLEDALEWISSGVIREMQAAAALLLAARKIGV